MTASGDAPPPNLMSKEVTTTTPEPTTAPHRLTDGLIRQAPSDSVGNRDQNKRYETASPARDSHIASGRRMAAQSEYALNWNSPPKPIKIAAERPHIPAAVIRRPPCVQK